VRTVILNFDRLAAGSLGCYGGMFLETPHFDELASRSLACDRYFITHTDRSLLDDLTDAGSPLLVLHNGTLPINGSAESLPSRVHVHSVPDLLTLSGDGLVELLGGLSSSCSGSTDDEILYLHVAQDALSGSALMQGAACWIADEDLSALKTSSLLHPAEKSLSAADSEPRIRLEEAAGLLETLDHAPNASDRHDDDPSSSRSESECDVAAVLLTPLILHTAQVIEQDRLLGKFLSVMDSVEAACDWLLVTASSGDPRANRSFLMDADAAGGSALAQRIPDWVRSVSDVVTKLPLLIHSPKMQLGERWRGMIQSDDLIRFLGTIRSTAGNQPDRLESEAVMNLLSGKRQLVYESPAARAVRDDDWLFVQRRNPPATADAANEGEERNAYLFRKPEDAWELLDVADQHPELVERLNSSE
jgi:hypothetical protein